jgi:hypothetical protein
MADAARSARGAFSDIEGGGSRMGQELNRTTGEARHGVMMLGEEFGIHLPRGLTTFIASLGPVGAAMEAAFPFIAIILGATLLLEHLAKLHEAGEKLTDDQMKLGVAVQNAFNSLDEKMLKAEQRADELRGDHLGALHKELELIDRQSMDELVQQFEKVAKMADVVFADLKSHWYTFGIGADGAKHALDTFQNSYDMLLAQGKDKEASDLLKGTKASAEKVLELQKQFKASGSNMGTGSDEQWANSLKHEEARNALKQYGVTATENEVKAQQALVDTLNAQVTIEQKVAALKGADSGAAKAGTAKKMNEEAKAAAAKALEAEKRAAEEAKKFYADAYRGYVEAIDEGERNTIQATKEGSAARLAAIDAAIKEEQKEHLEATGYYRELLTQRVQLVRQMGEEEDKARADAAKEMAQDDEKMAELSLAREKEHTALLDSARRVSDAQRTAEAIRFANEEEAIKAAALQAEMAALDKGGKDYANKLKALQDKEKQMVQQHENDITAIKDKAEMDRNTRILSAEQRAAEQTATGLTQSIMGHQTWARMITTFGDQAMEGLIRNSLMVMMQQDKERLGDARKAATSAYATGEKIGGPAGIVLGPVFAAAAFAGVMAFEDGGVVPGMGRGDTVPAMLTPGEGIIPGGIMDNLDKMSRSGSMGGATHYHAHVTPTYNLQALDVSGMEKILDKHSGTLTKHVENTLRKMNH